MGLARRLQTAVRRESAPGWRGHVVLLGALLSSNVRSCVERYPGIGPPTCDIGDSKFELSELYYVCPGRIPYA